jgi:hypothetical protein
MRRARRGKGLRLTSRHEDERGTCAQARLAQPQHPVPGMRLADRCGICIASNHGPMLAAAYGRCQPRQKVTRCSLTRPLPRGILRQHLLTQNVRIGLLHTRFEPVNGQFGKNENLGFRLKAKDPQAGLEPSFFSTESTQSNPPPPASGDVAISAGLT